MTRLTLLSLLGAALFAADRPLEVVPQVDLKKYAAGRWYEIGRLPNRFQRDCVSDVSASYTLEANGKITVLNACRKADGKMKSARGTAKLASGEGPNTKLKVTFFWPFYGDYWIIGLDPGYRWALVGEPERKYLWILSREPKLPESELQHILGIARERGFDTSRLVMTKQSL